MNNINKKRVLVTGVHGQVGRALKKALGQQCELVTAARAGADVNFDLSDAAQIKKAIEVVKPDIVINPAAYTQVDNAEDEVELARLINATAPGVMAELCKKQNALLVHYSTDYVFNGRGSRPYTEDDAVDPINVYGKTKLAGEQAIQAVNCNHLIFRTCWVYDARSKNFPNAILARAKTMETLKVVNDQLGTPTWAGFIADTTIKTINKVLDIEPCPLNSNRIYNLMPDGQASWYDFADALIKQELAAKDGAQLMVKEIIPVSTAEFPTKANRPAWSVLDNQKLKKDFGVEIDHWQAYMKMAFSIPRSS
ncbi:MAG: dTDP-4-dehydrorhamnose reductase [Spongiibacteraceae bacterium]